MQPVILDAVLTGTPQPLGPKAAPSSIATRVPAAGPVQAGPLGLAGDAVGDGTVHGGPDKAIHFYPRDHYDRWAAEQPPMAPLLAAPGAFGENLSARGLGEADVCLGDIVRAGSALLQLTQSRQPCWKLGVRFGLPALPRLVQKTGRTGWYYRVLESGAIGPGDPLTLVDRPNPGWTLPRTLRLLYVDMLDPEALATLAALPGISAGLARTARTRLETLAVEDWSRRLDGAPS
ncbi:MOSC domain-containing protein [Oleisolibacter albus]|uniref:MOSC domain-containing protein n=1 Tax=Oleisolibacter albus TaxID=2171757 RepID=UPI000DF3D302|nr:MOSC domain-containing protein [Oleisolibacter albus]